MPFYLRTGKRLSRRYSEIVIEYKKLPFSLFANDPNELINKLVIRLQPEETISLHTLNKKPGLTRGLRLQPVELNLTDESQNKRRKVRCLRAPAAGRHQRRPDPVYAQG